MGMVLRWSKEARAASALVSPVQCPPPWPVRRCPGQALVWKSRASPGTSASLGICGSAGLMRLSIETIGRSEEHTSELQSLMRISYAVFCLKKKKKNHKQKQYQQTIEGRMEQHQKSR